MKEGMSIQGKAAVLRYVALAITKQKRLIKLLCRALSLISYVPDIWHLPSGYGASDLVPGWVIKQM